MRGTLKNWGFGMASDDYHEALAIVEFSFTRALVLPSWDAVRLSLRRSRLQGHIEGGGRLRRRAGVLGDLLLQVLDGRVELGILAPKRGRRGIVHDEVGRDSLALHRPALAGDVGAGLGGACDAPVDEGVVEREPDSAAPGPRTHDLAEAQVPDPV